MRKPVSVKTLDELGRVRLSPSFFMRDFLYSEISQIEGIPNIPENPDLAIANGQRLCQEILEPLQQTFGRLSIRSAYRAPDVNHLGSQNKNQYNCSSNEANFARHIWDIPDKNGNMGAMACVVVNNFIPYYEQTNDWQALAYWIHDNISSYSEVVFFPKLCAFNIGWRENATKKIKSHIAPKKLDINYGIPSGNSSYEKHYAEMLGHIME